MNTSLVFQAVAAALAVASTGAFAHGKEEPAGKPKQFEAAAVETTAFGQEGNPESVSRTIQVDMTDTMRFTPADITVQRGETVKFVVANKGAVLHEMVIGTAHELQRHAQQMRKFPEMQHDAAYMAHVRPGKSGEIVWQFTQPGEFQFACLIPGHFEAGMVGKVTAVDAAMSEGEVRKVDKEASTLTLKHGPLLNLDMAGMTMVFAVADPSMLEQVKPGDKVRFTAERVNGKFTVVAIEAAN